MSLPFQRYIIVNSKGFILGSGSTDVEAFLIMREEPRVDQLHPIPISLQFQTGDIYNPVSGEVTTRPRVAVLDGMKLSNLPIPCVVTIDFGLPTQAQYTVTDGELEMEFEYPGTYTVEVNAEALPTQTFRVTQP